ncbi:hypothetical protein BJ166DRAFT_592110 [Pestalotiopsis sp. NC0098]|nr:hypothetical protein BJ166DRAFT_592110 [Pestalotiopsis sp. NC0098]
MTSTYQDGDFKGKEAKIRHDYSRFWLQPSAVADVEAYLSKNQQHQYSPTYERPEKWIRGNSHFRENNLNRGEILAENEYAVILGNRSSFDASQYPGAPGQASMSFIHVLGLSKQQIFNGVSLTQHTCGIIDDIIQLFESQWGYSDHGNEFRDKVIGYQQKMFDRQEARVMAQNTQDGDQSSTEYQGPAEYPYELSYKARGLKAEHFNYGLHLWPEQSVGHLHIHIIARPEEMRQYSTYAHDHKTVDARDVRDFILEEGPMYYVPPYRAYQKMEGVSKYYGPARDKCRGIEEVVEEEDEDEDPGYHEPVYDETQQALHQSGHQPS